MKKIKKIFALLIAMVMVLGMSTTVFAAEPGITVSNAVNGETYTAYKLLNATYTGELGDSTAIAYYYTGESTDELYTIMTGTGLQFDQFVNGKAYLKVKDGANTITYTEDQIKTLAENINTAMKRTENPLTLTQAGDAVASGGSATINVTEKGLYFVDTTLGSVCSIDTAGAAEIYEKNTTPSITKEVQEDTNNTWYTATAADGLTLGVATAALDDTVNYRMTVNTGTNTYATVNGVDANYVIVDTLPTVMTYKGNTFATTEGANLIEGADASATVAIEGWSLGTDYWVTYSNNDLTVTLSGTKIATLGQDTDIVITYKADFTETAMGNTTYTNTAVLTYKEQNSTSTAKVKSYEFELNKKNVDGDTLNGVVFTVSRTDGKYLNDLGEWVAVAKGEDAPELTTDENGKIVVSGIDDEDYTVTELKTLDGYNLLDAPIVVTVALDGTISVKSGDGTVDGTAITVINQSGTVLPSTGGIGTTMFYVIGGALVLVAVVLLVTRKRMSVEK